MPATETEALTARLLSDSALLVLVDERVTPLKPTQEPSGDYVVLQTISSDEGVMPLSGPNSGHFAEVRIEAYAGTEARAKAIIRTVKTRLHGWQDYAEGVEGCFARGDSSTDVIDRDWCVAGQSFGIRFTPS